MLHSACYAIGGTDSFVEKLEFEKYSPEWVITSHLNEKRTYAACAALESKF